MKVLGLPIFFLHDNLVAGIVHLEEVGYAMEMAVDVLVAVDGHEQLAVERTEQHAMAEVGRGDGLFFLHPRAVQCAAFRIGYSLGINIVNPTGPYHAQPSGLRAEKVRTVGHFASHRITIDDFAAPGGVAGAEQQLAFAHAAA